MDFVSVTLVFTDYLSSEVNFSVAINMLLLFDVSSLSVSKNVTVDKSPYKMTAEEATGIINHVSHFLSLFFRLQF